MRYWFVAAVLLLAGCTSPGNEEPVEPTSGQGVVDSASFDQTGPLSLSLRDLSAERDWVLIEAVLESRGMLSLHLDTDFEFPPTASGRSAGPEMACVAGWIGPAPFHTVYMDPVRVGAGSSITGSSEGVTQGYGTSFGNGISIPDTAPGQPVPLLVGLDQPEAWQDAGGTLEATLSADVPMRWRVVDSGTLDCGVGPESYDGGSWVRAGHAIHATDLSASWMFDSGGHVWVFGQTSGSIDVSVDGPEGTAWAVQWDQGEDQEPQTFRYNVMLSRLPPGAWEHRIETFTGPAELFGYLALDLPTRFQPPPTGV